MTQGSSVPTTQHTQNDVFLSPRVVDQRAFDELTGSLKGIVRDAVQQSEALLSSTGEVKLLGQQLTDATRELQQRVESAVRVVPTLDQRVAKVEQVLDKAESALAAKEQQVRELTTREVVIDRQRLALMVEEHLTSIVREKLATFSDQLVAKALESGPVTSRELEATMKRLKEAHDKVASATTAAEGKAATLKFQADATAASILTTVHAKADRLIGDAMTRSQTIVSEAQGKAAALIADAQARVDSLLSSFEDHATQVARRAHDPLEQLLKAAPAQVAQCEARAGLIVGELEKRLDQFEAAARQTGALVNPAETQRFLDAAQTASGRAAATLTTLHKGLDQAEDFSRQLASLTSQAETARNHLSENVLTQADNIDTIERRLQEIGAKQDALKAALDQALTRARQADASIEEQSKRFADSIEQAAQPGMQRLGQQAQQVGQWLTQLLQQSADVGHRLERLISEARATASGKNTGR
jgi:DNA repair exonuclease SbcCD ATPase subunit